MNTNWFVVFTCITFWLMGIFISKFYEKIYRFFCRVYFKIIYWKMSRAEIMAESIFKINISHFDLIELSQLICLLKIRQKQMLNS